MSTTESKINVRIDKKTKDEAKKTLESLGLDISSGIKLFLHSVVNTQSIPFEVRTKNGYTLQQEQAILDEAKKLQEELKTGKAKTYRSVKAMFEDIDNWDDEGNYVRT